MESLDPSASILEICGISSSQEYLLAHRRFALQPENIECNGSYTQSMVCDGIPADSTGIVMISQESSDDGERRMSSADHQTPMSLVRKDHDDEEINKKTPRDGHRPPSEEPRLSSADRQTPSCPPIMGSEDPFRSLIDFCCISSSQETILRRCHCVPQTEGSETQSTAGISVVSEEIDKKIQSKEARITCADEAKDVNSETEEEREGGEAVDLGRDADIVYESGCRGRQWLEISSEDEGRRKRSKVGDVYGSTVEPTERVKGNGEGIKRVLPRSITGRVEDGEMKEKKNTSLLDALELLSKREKYDDDIQNLSILEVAKRRGLTFP